MLRLIRLRTVTAAIKGEPPGPEASIRKVLADEHGQQIMDAGEGPRGRRRDAHRRRAARATGQLWHYGFLFARRADDRRRHARGAAQHHRRAGARPAARSGRGVTAGGAALLERARSLGPRIRTFSDEAESLRRLPSELVTVLAEAGLFKLGLPEEYGGPEVDPVTFIEIVDEVSAKTLGRGVVRDDRVDHGPDGGVPAGSRRRSDLRSRPTHDHRWGHRAERHRPRRRGRLHRHGTVAMGERHSALFVDLRRHAHRCRRLPPDVLPRDRRRDRGHVALIRLARHGLERLRRRGGVAFPPAARWQSSVRVRASTARCTSSRCSRYSLWRSRPSASASPAAPSTSSSTSPQ